MPPIMSLIVKQGVNVKYNKINGTLYTGIRRSDGRYRNPAAVCRVAKCQKETSNGKFTAMIVTENKQNVKMSVCFSELSHKVQTLSVRISALFREIPTEFASARLLLQNREIPFVFSKSYAVVPDCSLRKKAQHLAFFWKLCYTVNNV